MKLHQLFIVKEGGWSNTITQGVRLTPRNVKRVLDKLPAFEKALNVYLETRGLPAARITHPVGSTSYVERDLEKNPDKEYGDVDVMIELQPIEGMSDARAQDAYQDAIAEFTKTEAPDFVYAHDKATGQNVILKIGDNEYVQVDLIKTMVDAADWARLRTTPEYGVKGALIGFLYSSLAEVLHLSISQMGVQYKKKGGQLVKFRTPKGDETGTISRDFENFGVHIAEWMVRTLKPQADAVVIHPSLKRKPGMRRDEVYIKDLADVVKGIALTLELNGALGIGPLQDFETAEDVITAVTRVYLEKCIKAANNSKFDKAQTPEAKAKADTTKLALITKSKELAGYLKM